MRVIAIIVAILGLAVLVFGVLFIVQAGSGEDEVAESIAPLPLDQLDAQYDAVTAQYNQMAASNPPPDANLNYLKANKIGLGLAMSNIGLTQFTRVSGIIDIILGLGLVLAGIALMKRE